MLDKTQTINKINLNQPEAELNYYYILYLWSNDA